MERRQLFITAGTALTFTFGGCLDAITGGDIDGEIRPDGEPETVPAPLDCDRDDVSRHTRGIRDDLRWGDTDEFQLRIDGLSFEYGDTAEITLGHTGWGSAKTGSAMKYLLEVKTDAGWQDVRVVPEDSPGIAPPDELIEHDSTEIFTWELDLTEAGLARPAPFEEYVSVCPELPAGRYRFLYYGLGEHVAVAFDLER